jgi:hypothetical protein
MVMVGVWGSLGVGLAFSLLCLACESDRHTMMVNWQSIEWEPAAAATTHVHFPCAACGQLGAHTLRRTGAGRSCIPCPLTRTLAPPAHPWLPAAGAVPFGVILLICTLISAAFYWCIRAQLAFCATVLAVAGARPR